MLCVPSLRSTDEIYTRNGASFAGLLSHHTTLVQPIKESPQRKRTGSDPKIPPHTTRLDGVERNAALRQRRGCPDRMIAYAIISGMMAPEGAPGLTDPQVPPMATDSTKNPDTIATTIHDPRLPERSGWTNAEIIWEQIQEAAAECERKNENAEASELWRGAMELAREHLPPHDLRVATSMVNLAIVERREGDSAAAKRGIEEALALWDAGDRWIESLRPISRARSSTFHLRLQTKHAGAYHRFPRERYRTLAIEGRAVLADRRDGLPDRSDRLERWRRERPDGFNDWRKLLSAVLLIASGAPR